MTTVKGEAGMTERAKPQAKAKIKQTNRGIEVVYRSISELGLDSRNPRLHGKRQLRQIARSIEAFGFNVPVLVDAKSKVIAGHGRILACQLLDWSEVPTICLSI